jgi:MFS family permease
VVRQRSAKPLYAGSILARTSKLQHMSTRTNARLSRNITLLKWLHVDEVLFAAAVLIAYEMHVIGISLTQVLIGEAIFAFTVLTFEIPSGVFSDLVSRKKTLLIAQVLLIIGVAFLAFAQNFFHIILIQIIWGIAASTISGTDSAMLYDTLKLLKRERDHKQVLGHITAFSLVAVAFGQVTSGFIGSFNLHLTLILCIPIPIIKFILILFLQEPEREKSHHTHTPISHAFSSIGYIIRNRVILVLIIASMFTVLGWKIAIHTYNPFMELIEVPIVYWGIALAVFNLLAAYVSKKAHMFIEYAGEMKSFIIIFCSYAISFFLLAGINSKFAFFALLLIWVANPVKRIFFSEELNKRTASSQRATVLSVSNFCSQGLQMIMLPILGYVADIYSLQTMYLLLGAIIFAVGLIAMIGLRQSLINESSLNS